jgi:hypothetical protein
LTHFGHSRRVPNSPELKIRNQIGKGSTCPMARTKPGGTDGHTLLNPKPPNQGSRPGTATGHGTRTSLTLASLQQHPTVTKRQSRRPGGTRPGGTRHLPMVVSQTLARTPGPGSWDAPGLLTDPGIQQRAMCVAVLEHFFRSVRPYCTASLASHGALTCSLKR